jgi:hypothetical protein
VFFTCYDVGPNEVLKVFVQHVVCTLAIREGDGLNLYLKLLLGSRVLLSVARSQFASQTSVHSQSFTPYVSALENEVEILFQLSICYYDCSLR